MEPLRAFLSIVLRNAFALAFVFLAVAGRAADEPFVAAAADLKFALTEISTQFEKHSGQKLKLSFGSSGNFARQIAQGAPFQLFFSADERYADGLVDSGHAAGRGALYGVGRIVVYTPRGSVVAGQHGLAGVAAALDAGRLRRFAIANPEHAPYGRAARQALQRAGLWPRLEGKLLLGENAAQAAQFAASDGADGGILPLALALAPALAQAGSYALIAQELHEPLRQRVVLLKGAGETARRFYDYVQQPAARAVFQRYGFAPP